MNQKSKIMNYFQIVKKNQFRQIFLKNWTIVFFCIILPLASSTLILQSYSNDSLLQEMDAGVQRSADNTTTTIRVLLEEASSLLRKIVVNDDIITFMSSDSKRPQTYGEIQLMRSVRNTVSTDFRENLYYSIDIYSTVSNQLVSSKHQVQSYLNMIDGSLLAGFTEGVEQETALQLFADIRTLTFLDGETKRVITLYQPSLNAGKNGFASISIDCEKLTSYLIPDQIDTQESYLLVDKNGKVLLDTTGKLDDQVPPFLIEDAEGVPLTQVIDGQRMRIVQNNIGMFGWKFVQIVPMSAIKASSMRLWTLLAVVVLLAVIAAFFISYGVTYRLFRPIQAILQILSDPENRQQVCEENDEYQYLLVQILELFQKNTTLETAIVERSIALRSARSKALQKQMTPHFLNNVLQSINWIAIQETGNHNGKTSQAIMLLADIIRIGKEQKSNVTTVDDEIEYSKKFIELEQLRFGDGIVCEFAVAESLHNAMIPCMSLQVLIENAVLHGLEPAGEFGNIYVKIMEYGSNGLRICVEDSGVGIQQEAIDRINSFMKQEYTYLGMHLGLVNLFQRFRLIYGDDCVFNIGNSKYGGACIEILVPTLE